MFAALIPLIDAAGIWLARIGVAYFAYDVWKNLTGDQKSTIQSSMDNAAATGLPADEQKKLIAATTYEQVEKSGKSPDDFWAGLSGKEKEALKFSPNTIREAQNRTSFLGTAQTVSWVAAGFLAGLAAFRGVPIVSSGLGKLAQARLAGATAAELATIIEEVKMGVLQRVWVPGTVAGIAAGGGWLTGAMANNMNDAFLWGRIFLDQAAQDVQKAADKKAGGSVSGSASGISSDQPKIIIRMVQEKKPEQYIGTLFSAKLGDSKSFERQLDDEVTDENDLREDVKLNLNRWLATLPGRLGYSVVIRKDPIDEFGVKQSGLWATLTTTLNRLNGTIQPVDTILLGPVRPEARLTLSKVTKQIESEIPGMLTGQQVVQIEVPKGTVDYFNLEGERVDLSGTLPAATPAATSTPAATQPMVTPVTSPTSGTPQQSVPLATITPTPTVQYAKPAGPAPVITPTPAPTVTPPAPASAPAATLASVNGLALVQGNSYTTNTPGSVLNLRRDPNTSGQIYAKIPDGTRVLLDTPQVRGMAYQPIIADNYHWVFVITPSGSGGYVAAEYLKA